MQIPKSLPFAVGEPKGLWSVLPQLWSKNSDLWHLQQVSVFWAWVNCRVLKWINLVTLKPFFYKARKRISSSHPNEEEICWLLQNSQPAQDEDSGYCKPETRHTNTLSRGSLLSLPAYIWQPSTSTSFFYSCQSNIGACVGTGFWPILRAIHLEGSTDITALTPLHIALLCEIYNPSHHTTILHFPYPSTMHVSHGKIVRAQWQTRTLLCHHQL